MVLRRMRRRVPRGGSTDSSASSDENSPAAGVDAPNLPSNQRQLRTQTLQKLSERRSQNGSSKGARARQSKSIIEEEEDELDDEEVQKSLTEDDDFEDMPVSPRKSTRSNVGSTSRSRRQCQESPVPDSRSPRRSAAQPAKQKIMSVDQSESPAILISDDDDEDDQRARSTKKSAPGPSPVKSRGRPSASPKKAARNASSDSDTHDDNEEIDELDDADDDDPVPPRGSRTMGISASSSRAFAVSSASPDASRKEANRAVASRAAEARKSLLDDDEEIAPARPVTRAGSSANKATAATTRPKVSNGKQKSLTPIEIEDSDSAKSRGSPVEDSDEDVGDSHNGLFRKRGQTRPNNSTAKAKPAAATKSKITAPVRALRSAVKASSNPKGKGKAKAKAKPKHRELDLPSESDQSKSDDSLHNISGTNRQRKRVREEQQKQERRKAKQVDKAAKSLLDTLQREANQLADSSSEDERYTSAKRKRTRQASDSEPETRTTRTKRTRASVKKTPLRKDKRKAVSEDEMSVVELSGDETDDNVDNDDDDQPVTPRKLKTLKTGRSRSMSGKKQQAKNPMRDSSSEENERQPRSSASRRGSSPSTKRARLQNLSNKRKANLRRRPGDLTEEEAVSEEDDFIVADSEEIELVEGSEEDDSDADDDVGALVYHRVNNMPDSPARRRDAQSRTGLPFAQRVTGEELWHNYLTLVISRLLDLNLSEEDIEDFQRSRKNLQSRYYTALTTGDSIATRRQFRWYLRHMRDIKKVGIKDEEPAMRTGCDACKTQRLPCPWRLELTNPIPLRQRVTNHTYLSDDSAGSDFDEDDVDPDDYGSDRSEGADDLGHKVYGPDGELQAIEFLVGKSCIARAMAAHDLAHWEFETRLFVEDCEPFKRLKQNIRRNPRAGADGKSVELIIIHCLEPLKSRYEECCNTSAALHANTSDLHIGMSIKRQQRRLME